MSQARTSEVALITGGGRGLGRAFALALAARGSRVAVASRSAQELEATVAQIRGAGGDALAIPTDVTDERAVQDMLRTAMDRLGPIDLLINNAGAAAPFGPTWEADPGEWWRNIEVNLKGPLLCSNAVIPAMIKSRRGRIINVASGAGAASYPYMSAYVTAKAALIRFTEVLAGELKEHGISVFSIQPGTVRTAMAEEVLQSEAARRWLPWFQKIFDNRQDITSGPAEDLILYLASGAADPLSGRFFAAPGAPSNLTDQTGRILEHDLNVLRIRDRA